MAALNLQWIKYTSGNWCALETLDLSQAKGTGNYIIWHAGNPGRVVRVGQGDIPARLAAHLKDTAIMACKKHGTLFVTWANVEVRYLDGVERHLAEQWRPLVGDRFPDVPAIAVNSPWG